MANMNWACPTCGQHTTITAPNISHDRGHIYCEQSAVDSGILLESTLILCPNMTCKAPFFEVKATFGDLIKTNYGYTVNPHRGRPVGIGTFTFLPTTATPLSATVPAGIVEDYNEAHLIAKLSPKASATLARRALQGMVRDFHGIALRTLHDEIEAIRERCDADLYEAMMGLKSIGNIGAHPERDTSLIVEVEPDEPIALLDLIHELDRAWYVARAESQKRAARVREIAAQKKLAQATPPRLGLAPPNA